MENIKYKKYNYKQFISIWGIAILFEAGYFSYDKNKESIPKEQIKSIGEGVYFYYNEIPYPQSQQLIPEELVKFCWGLSMVSKQIADHSPYGKDTLIVLGTIEFSLCYIQEESFTAAAIEWAADVFGFDLPDIQVTFDRQLGVNGLYVYDFSAV